MENDLFKIIFRQLGSFLRIFGKVKELLVLELYEMIKVLHAVACPMNFNLIVVSKEEHSNLLKMIIC